MSEIVEVVRIEKGGVGPWRSDAYYELEKVLNRRFNSYKHREHSMRTVDMQSYSIRHFLFGFHNKKDLMAYFGKRLVDMMLRRGFVIKTYKTEKKYILQGKGEIAFPKPGVTPESMRDPFAQMYAEFGGPISFRRYAALEPVLDNPKFDKSKELQELTDFFIKQEMLKGNWEFSIDPS
jgi:hypothetical protein